MLTSDEIEELKILEEFEKRDACRSLLAFTKYTKQNYIDEWYHRKICDKIDAFERGEIKKMMIFVPPQHGKSELSTRRYPAYTLGRDPDQKIGVISYSQTVGSKFGKDIQRIMEEPTYKALFPDVRLDNSKGDWLKNKAEFEIPNYSGYCISIGTGGALTSRQIDKLIIDDIYKDAKDAWSPVKRQAVQDWYETVAETRLHNDSQILIVFTRWHEQDLGGWLLKNDPDAWEVVKFEAIRTDEPNNNDPREIGEALWNDRHSKEKLMRIKQKNPIVFGSLYQQDPQPAQGRMYTRLMEYEQLPEDPKAIVKSYCDSADRGEDYLCSIVYLESQGRAFILDVIYTQDPVEVTETLCAEQYDKWKVQDAVIESNGAGRQFGRNVERILKDEIGNKRCYVIEFTQKHNKEVRINAHASLVQNQIYFPQYWQTKFPEFYDAMTKYLRVGDNEHDDAPDAVTGIAQELENQQGAYLV